MLRKIMVFIFVICVGFYSQAEAAMYANADPNYPIWTSGNRAGGALDLTSAVEIPVGAQCFQVCCLNFSIVYEKGDGEYYEYGELVPDGYVYFREHDGIVYCAKSQAPTNTLEWKRVTSSITKEAFKLVKKQVKKNYQESECPY